MNGDIENGNNAEKIKSMESVIGAIDQLIGELKEENEKLKNTTAMVDEILEYLKSVSIENMIPVLCIDENVGEFGKTYWLDNTSKGVVSSNFRDSRDISYLIYNDSQREHCIGRFHNIKKLFVQIELPLSPGIDLEDYVNTCKKIKLMDVISWCYNNHQSRLSRCLLSYIKENINVKEDYDKKVKIFNVPYDLFIKDFSADQYRKYNGFYIGG